MQHWEAIFPAKMAEVAGGDSAHDFSHFQRVVHIAKQLCEEQLKLSRIKPQAWLSVSPRIQVVGQNFGNVLKYLQLT